jgi:hypothetical protein
VAEEEEKEEKPKKKKRSLARRIARGFGIAIGVVVLLVVLLVAWLHTDSGNETLRARIETRINERVTTKVTIGKLRFSLFSGIVLEDVAVLDRDGQKAIGVGRVFVDPKLDELLGGTIYLSAVNVEKVEVAIRGRADGTTNLTGLVRPQPEQPQQEKKDRHIIVRKIGVRDVAVHVTKPDGSKIDVEGITIDGDVDTQTVAGNTHAAVALGVKRVGVEQPQKLTLVVSELATKAKVDLVAGAGTIAIGPTGAGVRVTRSEEQPKPFETKLSLPKLDANVTKEHFTIALETFELAALSIATAKVEAARKEDGSFGRVEKANVTKLTVKAADVEALAGKRVLASDLSMELEAAGPADAFEPKLRIMTAGGEIDLGAKLDMRDSKMLRYEAKLGTKSLDVNRVYASEKLPPLTIGELSLSAKGERVEGVPPKVNATLALRDVHVRDVTIDAVDAKVRVADNVVTIEELIIRALGQKIDAKGSYKVEQKEIDAVIVADARVGELLGRLRRAGVLTTAPSPIVSALSLSRPVTVHITGKVDGDMVVEVDDVDARVAGGSARAHVVASITRGDPAKNEKAVIVRHVSADVDLNNVSLAEIGRLRGKPLPVAGRASGKVHVDGDIAAPGGDLDLTVDLVAPEDPKTRVGKLHAKGKATGGRIEVHAELTNASNERLATIDVKGARAGKSVGAPLTATVDVPERSLGEIAPLLQQEIREKLPKDVRVAVKADVKGEARHTHVEADVTAKLSPDAAPITVKARADLDGPPSAASTAPLAWNVDLDVPETELSALPLPPERKAALAGVGGKVAITVHAHGTRDDVQADAKLTAKKIKREGGLAPPLDARVGIALEDSSTNVTLEGDLAEVPTLRGSVNAALGGKGLLASARKGLLANADPALSGEIKIPDHSMEEWSTAAPGAHGVPGKLGGRLTIKGKARDPDFDLALTYDGYPTLGDKPGSLAINAKGTRETATITAKVNDAVTLKIDVSPDQILKARKQEGGAGKIHVALDAKQVPLATLIPANENTRPMHPTGVVDAAMTADATLVFKNGGETRELGELKISGPLTLENGTFQVPTAKWRRVHDASVKIEGDGDKIAIRNMSLRESDRDEPNRTLAIDGAYNVRERDLTLHAKTNKVLLSGGNFGALDAPKAALTADLAVHAALGGPVRQVVVDVNALDLESGDRQPRAVQQEVLSLGDVLEVGPGGVEVGKLPRPPEKPLEPVPSKEASPKATEEKTLDVIVRVPNTIHVKQRPLELFAKGEIHIERFGERRVLSGQLVASDGSLLVGGRPHKLTKGEVRMTDEGAFLDLHFRREPHPAALRDISTADGTDVYAHMVGPFGKQKISFSGKTDGLFEALALENIGRVRILSTPDAPAGQTTQLPQVPQIRQTAFMSANLPHLAFLDRMNTFADSSANRFAYGRFENLEAERYSKDGTRRIRTTVRSRVIGQSDAEVEGSLLFRNDARVVTGVGILGGTRLGGGPTIFYEWSSAD